LGLLYLDTGAMYRAVGLAVLESGASVEEADKAVEIARTSEITLAGPPEDLQIFINGRDVSKFIRTPEVGQAASQVSTISEVRRILVRRQQELGKLGSGCVLDGRDIGTVVFPQADVKFFLTAKPEARARRRFEEDKARGTATSYEQTLEEINQRDRRDVSRADSPLSIAADAMVMDTSELNLTEAFEEMLEIIRGKKVALNNSAK
jgi:cytidylate kinase